MTRASRRKAEQWGPGSERVAGTERPTVLSFMMGQQTSWTQVLARESGRERPLKGHVPPSTAPSAPHFRPLGHPLSLFPRVECRTYGQHAEQLQDTPTNSAFSPLPVRSSSLPARAPAPLPAPIHSSTGTACLIPAKYARACSPGTRTAVSVGTLHADRTLHPDTHRAHSPDPAAHPSPWGRARSVFRLSCSLVFLYIR